MYRIANEKWVLRSFGELDAQPRWTFARPLQQRVDSFLQAVCERRLPRLTGLKTPLEDRQAAAAVATAAGALDPGEK